MTLSASDDRRAFVHALVAEFAPAELPEFDLMTEAYFAAPGAARRARRPRDEAGGSWIDLGDPTLTALLWNIVGGVSVELMVLTARTGRDRWRKRNGRSPLDEQLPELPGEKSGEAREIVVKALDEARVPRAEEIADRFVDRWGRRDWTPPE